MKKLLLSTIVLLAFSISLLIFDMSCRKDLVGQSDQTADLTLKNGSITSSNNSGIVLYSTVSTSGVQLWRMNYDGTGKTQINIVAPTDFSFDLASFARVSPDGKKLFFTGWSNSGSYHVLCSANIEGTNFKVIVKFDPAISTAYLNDCK